MKVYREIGIINDVRECIDEMGVNEAELIGGTDDEDLSAIIKSKIAESVRFVFLSADISMLEPFNKTYDTANSLLPEDAIRICMITSSAWLHPVFKVIPFNSNEYASLKNVYTTGYSDNPKVAYVLDEEGKKCLEFYPPLEGDAKATVLYMKEPTISNGGYTIPEKVYRAVVYYAAGLTLMTFKDAHADRLINQATQMIGVN